VKALIASMRAGCAVSADFLRKTFAAASTSATEKDAIQIAFKAMNEPLSAAIAADRTRRLAMGYRVAPEVRPGTVPFADFADKEEAKAAARALGVGR